jgi:CheY-like chemotaxis protein
MLRLLLCSDHDLRPELAATVVGRQAVEMYRVDGLRDLRLLAATLDPQAILVDRDVAGGARELIEALRQEPSTRNRSVAVLARGDLQPQEVELLDAGANAILRLPPDPGWDERLARLLKVPARQEARLGVQLAVEMEPAMSGTIENLSQNGMLLAPDRPLRLFQELGFHFTLPDRSVVNGRARVVRLAGEDQCGVVLVQIHAAPRHAVQQYLRSARLL